MADKTTVTDGTAEDAASEEPVVVAATEPEAAPAAPPPSQPAAGRVNRRKVREGIVVSSSMDATIVVAVVERVRHPRYRKTVQRTKRLYAHDAEGTAKVGDRVRVVESRPLSMKKRWRLS